MLKKLKIAAAAIAIAVIATAIVVVGVFLGGILLFLGAITWVSFLLLVLFKSFQHEKGEG